MKKKIMALLLAFVLCSTVMPSRADADGEAFAMQITVKTKVFASIEIDFLVLCCFPSTFI